MPLALCQTNFFVLSERVTEVRSSSLNNNNHYCHPPLQTPSHRGEGFPGALDVTLLSPPRATQLCDLMLNNVLYSYSPSLSKYSAEGCKLFCNALPIVNFRLPHPPEEQNSLALGVKVY